MVHVGGMKREREMMMDPSITNYMAANCLMILAHGGGATGNQLMRHEQSDRVFECKTCKRQFSSFQALGGHRASHKKPKHTGDPNSQLQPSLALMISSQSTSTSPAAKPKPKTHECSICGLEFAIGQALGGHMRRHRAVTLAAAESESNSSGLTQPVPIFVPHVLKRSNSSRRICLDLNLTPKENGMDYHQILNIRDHKNISPILHCYL